jgi:SIT4-associating protein SAP185/190
LDDQANPHEGGDDTSSHPINIPPPLNVPPSRARRLFAARVAARRKEAEEAADLDAAAAKQVEHSQSNYSKSHSRTSSGGLDDPRSDDSLDGGEDVGIVMRKSVRSAPTRLGRSIFTLDGSGDDDEEDDDDDEDEEDDEGEGEVDADIVAELEKLGIDVRTPPATEDDVD